MFTGLIEETGRVESIKPGRNKIELSIRIGRCGRSLRVGDSLSLNGSCLTIVKVAKFGKTKIARFDLLQETWRLTNLQFAGPGSRVNLERPLRADGRLDGHFVTGHIDGLGRIVRWERKGRDYLLDVAAPAGVMRYVVMKGSIAVDGISLTVAGVQRGGFRVWIIPHTYEVTALRERRVGDAVNLEADLIGKYVRKFVTSSAST